jgi:Ferredoxin
MKIHIDRQACIGSAACVATAGKSFSLDGEGKAVVLNPPGDDSATILEAEAGCPTRAIQVLLKEDGDLPAK